MPQDIFDQAAKSASKGDIFDQAASIEIPDATKQAQAVVRRPIEAHRESTFIPTHPYGGGGLPLTGTREEIQPIRDVQRGIAETGAASAATAGLGGMGGILGWIARGLASGGAAGGTHALSKTTETGSPDVSGSAKTGATFAAAEMGGEALAKSTAAIASKLRPKIDPTIKLNDLLGVTRKEVKVGSTPETLSDFAQNPGRGLMKSGLDEKTLSKMNPLERNQAISKARDAVGAKLEQVFKAASQPEGMPGGLPERAGQMAGSAKKVDFQKVMDSVFDEKVIPDQNLAKQTADRLTQILDKAGVKDKALLSQLTPEQAWRVRRELDEFADFAPAETARTFRQVATKLRRGLSDSLHKAVPDSAPLDQHYSDLVGATNAARRQAADFARTTPESKLRKWILKTAIKAGTRALPLP